MKPDRKKELKQQYKEMKTYYGVIRIKNESNGKKFIDAVPNVKNRWLTSKMILNDGRHMNKELQEDWHKYGEEVFSYEVLWQKDKSEINDMKFELQKKEKRMDS
ncbi:GIY-YIG nuclease family protein [Cytobacillus kochii]|uniref:GIY-YIG nuclease family protein n=1 Tax=Cytobacillus kochii TaxID=859143 RepID=UPI001C593860|nr:GIY-YIG nuclease family protein [Cytobacillus kochii]